MDSVLPFWLEHSQDKTYGGYFSCLDRDGSVYDTDKFIWLQGREVWLFSMLCNKVEKRKEWLDCAIQGGECVLDLGSGSGILSITAILLGAAHATGVDIDPKAEDIARENAAINQIFADRFTAVTGDVIGDKAMMESLKGHYDVVLANIVADVIIPLSRVVPEFLQEDSIFICSGILNTRLPEVLDALEKNGLQILSTEQQEDWCRVTAALLET